MPAQTSKSLPTLALACLVAAGPLAGCQALIGIDDPIVGDPLASLVLSAPVELAPAFDPAETAYAASASILVQTTTVTATAVDPQATITVNGTPVASGMASLPIALDLGTTTVAVEVIAGGQSRTYSVAVDRAADIAQYAYGKASNTDAGDQFGTSVALSGDTLAVGAPFEDSAATGIDGDQVDNSASASGAVYVFRRAGTAWAQEAYIKASNTDVGNRFGTSVALSGDTLAVGATGEASAATGIGADQADNSADESGAVYVFRRAGTAWAQEAYIKASNTDPGDQFGYSVALWGDTLAVGARHEDSAATGIDGDQDDNSATNSGAVYVFRRAGAAWAQEAYLKASNTGAGDRFSRSVALSGDTLAVGAPFEDSATTGIDGDQADNSTEWSGAVYLFH